MPQLEFRQGSPGELSADGGDACTLSVVIDSDARWRLELIAHFQGGGSRVVGRLNTCPASVSGGPPSRVVAAACLPGVRSWSVRARCLGTRGVKPITVELVTANGIAQPSYVDLEVRHSVVLSGANGVVQIEPGRRLVSIAVWADAAGAFATVVGDAPIAVPIGIPVAASYSGRYVEQVIFGGTTHYMVEVEG